MKKQTYVLVPIEWLESLQKDSKKISDFLDKNGYDISEHKIKMDLCRLVGSCQSVETVIKYSDRIEK